MPQPSDVLRHLGQVMRKKDNDITRQSPPVRWVDLIHHLNEQERKQQERKQKEAARCQTGPPDKSASQEG